MKGAHLLIFIVVLINLRPAFGQAPTVYESELLGVRFISDSQWVSKCYDGKVFMVENKNHNIQVRVWHTDESVKVGKCLEHVVLNEGLCKMGEPFSTTVDGKRATAIIAGCVKMHRPYRVLIMAVEKERGYDIFSATCPEDCFKDHCKQMKLLIRSFEYIDQTESFLYYTSRSGKS